MIKRLLSLLLAVFLTVSAGIAEGGSAAGASLEPSTGSYSSQYPWVAVSPSAVLYLSSRDVDKWLDTVNEDLPRLLEELELDFADARNALSGYLKEEIPPVKIFIQFWLNESPRSLPDAEYSPDGGIYLYRDWVSARYSLLHEYVHYLTYACSETRIETQFWREGIAEYVSKFLCRNRMARSVNMNISGEALSRHSALLLDPQDGTADPKRIYLVTAELQADGTADGKTYRSVSGAYIQLSEELRKYPSPDSLTYHEAACMIAFLAETYGKDEVFSHWNSDPVHMEDVFGKGFSELYGEWVRWNRNQCLSLQNPE